MPVVTASPGRPRIPFNRPYITGREAAHIDRAVAAMQLSANGRFTEMCSSWLAEHTGAAGVILTHTCTAALEMAAILADIGPGDEVIMPSFTFVTTSSAFVLRGATPVFVDVCEDTLNIDPALARAAVTPATKAIVGVDYAGVGCDMTALRMVATDASVALIEDAAQGLLSRRGGQPLGSAADLATLSFHETKNVQCGEGGALLLNDPALVERAQIVRDKGTNRSSFLRGDVQKYEWVDLGSSFGLSELAAAFLWGQIEGAEEITARRLAIWARYHEGLAGAERAGFLRRPIVPDDCEHNAHMYYVLLPDPAQRRRLIEELESDGIMAVFHYVPLHSSPAGRRYGRVSGELDVTDTLSERLLRLPLWTGMTDHDVDDVIASVIRAMG